MNYLLDTDHISVLQRPSGIEHDTLLARILVHGAENLSFSIVSFHEQVLGAHTFIARARISRDLIRGYRLLDEILRGFSAAHVLSLDQAAIDVFDGLMARRVRVATMDLRIGAIALANNRILLTRNVRDFGKVPGLKTEDWTA